jgi:hypothetical protein
MVHHLLLTFKFRLGYAVSGLPEDFSGFSPGMDVQTPEQLMSHICHLLEFTRRYMDNSVLLFRDVSPPAPLPWAQQLSRAEALADEISDLLKGQEIPERNLKKLLQGPLTDVFTHIGQLAMLRRLYGKPVERISFFQASIGEQ